ncbi:MAG TPA: DUF4383 domain-containing protein [Gaiellaceae bacterium]|nr:DUF4383 domain-containing protein [Gaiellaceae bacterium]
MSDRTPIQVAAALTGVVLVVVGILGFVPGVTTHYGDLSFAGHDSRAKLLGIFQVSILQNLVPLLFGVVGLVLARTAEGARMFLTGGGVVSLALWVLGVVGAGDWLPTNTADNWLHFLLGIGMIGVGDVAGRSRASPVAV